MSELRNKATKYPVWIDGVPYTVIIEKNEDFWDCYTTYSVEFYKGKIGGIFKLFNKLPVYETCISQANSYVEAYKTALKRCKYKLAKTEQKLLAEQKELDEFNSFNGEVAYED